MSIRQEIEENEPSGMPLSQAVGKLEAIVSKTRGTRAEKNALGALLRQASELQKLIREWPVLEFRGRDGTMRPEPEVTVQVRDIILLKERELRQQEEQNTGQPGRTERKGTE